MVFYLLPPLMLLLFAGTVAQKSMGLFAAQKLFFSSFIFWLGPIPLPGGYLLIALLSLSLTCKFLLNSDWNLKKSGINLTHLGVLVLLIGGLLTALDARESYMAIAEGDQSSYMYDYTQRELVLSSENAVQRIAFEQIEKANLPFNLSVIEKYDNCQIEKRAETDQDFGDKPMRAFAQFMALKPKAKDKDPEANLSGLTFEIKNSTDEQNGIYIAFEGMPKPIKINHDGRDYGLIFGKAQRSLPFTLKLKEFEKQIYPGTDKARDYVSELEIIDGDITWPARIEMNEPLRYKGYTFFQSSFERIDDQELTILSVVENRGWLFPYIGTAIITIGLLLHLFLMMNGRKRA